MTVSPYQIAESFDRQSLSNGRIVWPSVHIKWQNHVTVSPYQMAESHLTVSPYQSVAKHQFTPSFPPVRTILKNVHEGGHQSN